MCVCLPVLFGKLDHNKASTSDDLRDFVNGPHPHLRDSYADNTRPQGSFHVLSKR
jgi:hypothetical protein